MIFTGELNKNINNNSYLKIFMEILNPESHFYQTFGNIDEISIQEYVNSFRDILINQMPIGF